MRASAPQQDARVRIEIRPLRDGATSRRLYSPRNFFTPWRPIAKETGAAGVSLGDGARKEKGR